MAKSDLSLSADKTIADLKAQLSIKELEIQLLLAYVSATTDGRLAAGRACQCGAPPFTDGEKCDLCFGQFLLHQFKTTYWQDYAPTAVLPEGKTMILDLDKLVNLLAYLDQINDTPFEQMIFIKDNQPVELMLETLETWAEFMQSHVEVYAIACRGIEKVLSDRVGEK